MACQTFGEQSLFPEVLNAYAEKASPSQAPDTSSNEALLETERQDDEDPEETATEQAAAWETIPIAEAFPCLA